MDWSISYENPDNSTILDHLNALRLDNILIDFTVETPGGRISCHKVVLAASSKYFNAMFQSQMKESASGVCILPDFSYKILEGLINYMYTNKLTVEKVDIYDYVCAADFLGLVEVMKSFDNQLIERVDLSSCVALYQLATVYGMGMLKHYSRSFILENMSVLLVDLEYDLHKLRPCDIVDLLSDNDLIVSSESGLLINVICHVIRNSYDINTEKMILGCVRLDAIDHQTMLEDGFVGLSDVLGNLRDLENANLKHEKRKSTAYQVLIKMSLLKGLAVVKILCVFVFFQL